MNSSTPFDDFFFIKMELHKKTENLEKCKQKRWKFAKIEQNLEKTPTNFPSSSGMTIWLNTKQSYIIWYQIFTYLN